MYQNLSERGLIHTCSHLPPNEDFNIQCKILLIQECCTYAKWRGKILHVENHDDERKLLQGHSIILGTIPMDSDVKTKLMREGIPSLF